MKTSIKIGDYLIKKLYSHGVRHVLGIPGDYVLKFYEMLNGGIFNHGCASRPL